MLASWQQPYCPQCNMSSETNGRILLAPGRSASGPVGRFLRGEEAGCQREQAVWFMRQAARAYGSQVLAAPGEAGTAGPEALQLDCGDGQALADLGGLLWWDDPPRARAAFERALEAGNQHALQHRPPPRKRRTPR